MQSKAMRGKLHGCVYTFPRCAEGVCPRAHFSGTVYLLVGVFSACSLHRYPKTSNDKQATGSTHAFLCGLGQRKPLLSGVRQNIKQGVGAF